MEREAGEKTMNINAQPQGIYYLPGSLVEDLEKLRKMTEQFKTGGVSAAYFQAFRVPMGVYEQRESGTFMLRVRLPAGGILPHQMRGLAKVAKKHGNGILHVTTRQDIQVHRVPLDAIYPALAALHDVGLSTKGGGGNTVRNITACYDSGVCRMEAFDVSPYAVALTEFLLSDRLSYELPRKYKIAFSGCNRDCAGATANDLGFIAKRRGDISGFTVYVGGGMGAHSRVADLLEDFVPASEFYLSAEAVKRVFDKYGNRKNKHKARLRFLIEQIGFEAFQKLYKAELTKLRAAPPSCPDLRPLSHPEWCPATKKGLNARGPSEASFESWRKDMVRPQVQQGYYIVDIPLFLGDIEADVLHSMGDIVEAYGEGMLRTTQWQSAVIRWVHEDELAQLHNKLDRLGLASTQPAVLRYIVACAGASTCKLGICLSRGLAKAIADVLSRSDLDLARLGDLKINISGCPNACGRHPTAQIGLFGAARRVGGRLVPYYGVKLGGSFEDGKTKLAGGKGMIPARNLPVFLRNFLKAFLESAQFPGFEVFLGARGRQVANTLIQAYKDVPDFEKDKNYYFDWGAKEIFSLAGRGPGECGAGVFDLIEVDLASADEALSERKYFAATALAARSLLVTRGEQPSSDVEAFMLFRKHFLEEGLVDPALDQVIACAIPSASAPHPERAFDSNTDDVAFLIAAVKNLYDNMDASLRFAIPEPTDRPKEPSESAGITVDIFKDFRGVVCPLNYVKTKLALEQMKGGQTLAILLDEEGARNVPASAAADRHEVLSVARENGHWRVLIRKAQEGK
jgi:sulfite reductase (ferredoxin)